MTKIQDGYENIEQLMDVLIDRLLNEREFRQAFFANPEKEAKKFKVHLDPQILKKLRSYQCPSITKGVANFDERLVLCSSVSS